MLSSSLIRTLGSARALGHTRLVARAGGGGHWSGNNGGRGGGGGAGGSWGGAGGCGGEGNGSKGPRKWALPLALSGALQLSMLAGSAMAARKKKEEELTIESVTNTLWQIAGPVLTNLGFSGMVGLVAGAALKKVGQALALIIGLGFLCLQGLAYTGAITVNWSKMNDMVNTNLDINKDGKLDHDDFKVLVGNGLAALATGVPSVGGFLGGFVLGLKV